MGSFNYADTGKPVLRKCSDCGEITPLAEGNDVLCEVCWELEGERLESN